MIAFNRGPASQRGIGLPAMAAILVLIGFVGLVLIKLWPVYMESIEVGSILRNVESEMSGRNAGQSELRKAINQRFQVNRISNVGHEAITFTPGIRGTEIVIAYEVRVPMFGNLDVIANFHKEALVRP